MQKNIGLRLKEERERMGLSQVAMGEIANVKKLTQLNYEKGERFPDALYLSTLANFGLDVQYVVTGIRTTNNLSIDEQDLIDKFRTAPLAIKAAALGALTAGTAQQTGVNISNNTIRGEGQIAGGNIYTTRRRKTK
ncbi:helix-turn-helix transcriptional regulator [Gilliamella sp. B2840]|uniref:helix-turn-helix domain-containing protein n=1 Tax=unclassified Gilliamella TaxID=2685620 RepID=UPI00226A664B|nr:MULTISPECIES: helix-turn-helix transcriptional regulator [unclassified Gilliamella]MCX8656457.1 helix-turn-helix transcriptional regulator [Gilliamella sp. B2894]MCX8692988.1 helix-turn-helix transcriptional regulator [Gilliamella sp. B2881]MCX8696227.1 helix-turn-helix transcriptional regulator [Gilliamella sp. B2828]MCX8701670.1 helix-turn-helix transcriptional regulator [Gilliamella sp. B2840]